MINFGVNPVIFEWGSFSLRWYGLFLALAVVWLVFWMWLQVKKGAKISLDTVLSMALVGIPSGIIFARVLHVIDNIVVASLHPELADAGKVINYLQYPGQIIGGEGLTAYGAVLGASLGVWIYCKIAKVKIGYVFDLLAPAIIFAQAIGRFGCLFNGCCYGTPTTLPWGLNYTDPQSFGFTYGVPTHPTVAYEIIYNIIIFGVLLKLRKRLKPDGSLYLLYLAFYAIWRIGVDFLRDGTPFLFGLHQAQVISIIVLLIAVPWMIKHTRWAKKEDLNPPAPDIAGPVQ
ncbi:MAG: prolipoprotein diacylglyceryl transferase [Dehalococcoidales bacterium]|nr:prolipoprotein diacylglyceryl transferase [Dehalococcoidales bacterium]